MRLFNSLTRKVEEFEPIKPPKVGVYTCGPTVYSFVTVGNWRTYVLGDVLVRVLKYFRYEPTYVMNITDVGHLTGDNLGDADTGEDRLEKAAVKEKRSAWELAQFYTDDFMVGFRQLNCVEPQVFCKATEHIAEQIAMVQAIEAKGLTYKIDDGIYFDTKAFEQAGFSYGELSNLKEIKQGARVEPNPQKKDGRDFALWKFSPAGVKRQMEWSSPWGVGFPGWHIECSAMSQKYLGDQFDLHVGGEDLRSTHHPNEMAQAEAATGKQPFVKYWIHGAFLLVDGGRMGKSLGNAYTLADLAAKGYEPMDLRYFYLTGHYRKQLNFTWEALAAARQARLRLVDLLVQFKAETSRTLLSKEKLEKVENYRQAFGQVVAEDLDMPQALMIVWQVAKSNLPGEDKYDLVIEMDEVLGLDLRSAKRVEPEMTETTKSLVREREALRQAGEFERADEVRAQLAAQGFGVIDREGGTEVYCLNQKVSGKTGMDEKTIDTKSN